MKAGYGIDWAERNAYVVAKSPEFKAMLDEALASRRADWAGRGREWIGDKLMVIQEKLEAIDAGTKYQPYKLRALAEAARVLSQVSTVMGNDVSTVKVEASQPLVVVMAQPVQPAAPAIASVQDEGQPT
jgi:hypothetical protein